MKVTGIERAEIIEIPMPEADPNVPRGENQLRRFELMERKRRQLIRELEDTAAALDETIVEAILSPTAADDLIEKDAHDTLNEEKRKIDVRRERVNREIQKEVEREMERNKAHDSDKKGREDWRRRLKEKNDEKAEELARRYDEIRRRTDKQEETLNKLSKEEWNKRKETMRKINETNERVTRQWEEKKQAWQNLSEERRRKIAEIVQKSMDIQKGVEDENIRKFEIMRQKQSEREERMQKAAEEALHQKRSKFADKMTVVSKKMQDKQDQRERTYEENLKRLEQARQAGKLHQEEVAERVRTAREKEMDKWQANRESRRKETQEKMKKLKAELSDSHAKSLEVQQRHLEETVYRKADLNRSFHDLVEQNKARIGRAEESAREQTLAKIRHTKDKRSTQLSAQMQVINYRNNAIREELIGRTHLNQLKLTMQDASTKRVNQLLKEFEMPPLLSEAAKEEGEEDKKQ